MGGRFLGPGDELDLSLTPLLCVGYTLDLEDRMTRMAIEPQLETLRRSGSRILLASHDAATLRRLSDEVWWIEGDRIVAQGDPAEILRNYERHMAERLRETGRMNAPAPAPAMRRGDGRGELIALQTTDVRGELTSVWKSGEEAVIRVTVRYNTEVEYPVVGIMIRTRIGMEVYGTNTELEGVAVGPCRSGDVRTVSFRFACDLCPGYYTLTAASHDPDGITHDWLEDAVGFTVSDVRSTAGVANLRAAVSCSCE